MFRGCISQPVASGCATLVYFWQTDLQAQVGGTSAASWLPHTWR